MRIKNGSFNIINLHLIFVYYNDVQKNVEKKNENESQTCYRTDVNCNIVSRIHNKKNKQKKQRQI